MIPKMAQGSMDSDRLSSAGISTHSSGTAGTLGGSVVGVRGGDNGLKQDEDEYNLGPLPPMWEKAFTPSGEVYFIDHNTGTSHWLDPRLARVRKRSLGECNEHELPYGWERVSDDRYGCYYVDHINRRTQYENPVLQAHRLREKIENVPAPQSSVPPPGELRGERFTVTLTKGTQGLGFTLIAAEGIPDIEGYLQIRSIMPHGPAWMDGSLRPGDVVVGVGTRSVVGLSHAHVAQIFQAIPAGSGVALHLVRGYPLSFDSDNTRVLSTLAVDVNTPDASAMLQLTKALRTRFNLDSPNTETSPSRDDPDASPVNTNQRRLMSRSFDLDDGPASNPVPPRCPSADHLLNKDGPHSTHTSVPREPGQEFQVILRRGAAGFGFTIADSVHGQKVKKVLDRSRCAGLREGDLLLQIGEHDIRHAPHQHVVQVLKECPAMHDTILSVWRRNDIGRTPRSRSATRVPAASTATTQLSRSKTPTAEQLRSPALRLNGNNTVEATYAVPEQKRERESLIDRRRRSSTPGGRLTLPNVITQADNLVYNQNNDRTIIGDQWPNETQQTDRTQLTSSQIPQWNDNQPPTNVQWQNDQQNDIMSGQWQNEPQNERIPQQWQQETWLDNSNNIRNWAESTQKWDNNNQYTENGQKWDANGHNGQKWGGNGHNGQKWDGNGHNGQKWDANDHNGQKWDANSHNGQKWDANGHNGQKWDANGHNGQKWEGNGWEDNGLRWSNGNWGEVGTPTVHVDMNYWRGNDSVADSNDNGGFPEDGMLHSPTTAAVSGLSRQSPARHRPVSPNNSGRLRSHSPSTASAHTADRLLANSPSRMQSQSPSSGLHQPYVANYPQVEAGGAIDPEADVLVRLARGSAGFGFRIVGGTEDGSRVAVGYVVPGGPADGLLRPGDLLTSVDGIPLHNATHAQAVSYVCQAATNGHATLGVRHNRADIHTQPSPELGAGYNILHPAPLYPPAPAPAPAPAHLNNHMPNMSMHGYGMQYAAQAWGAPYDVTVTRSQGEGFGFVVISSTNKATSTIGQLIPNSPAARCGLLHVGDTILAINRVPVRNLPHPEVVALIKRSGASVTLTILPPEGAVD